MAKATVEKQVIYDITLKVDKKELATLVMLLGVQSYNSLKNYVNESEKFSLDDVLDNLELTDLYDTLDKAYKQT